MVVVAHADGDLLDGEIGLQKELAAAVHPALDQVFLGGFAGDFFEHGREVAAGEADVGSYVTDADGGVVVSEICGARRTWAYHCAQRYRGIADDL